MNGISKRSMILLATGFLVISSLFSIQMTGEASDSPSMTPVRTSSIASDHTDTIYAIITTSELAGSFEPLSEWRSMTGNKASIFLLDGSDGIINSYPGSDNAESLFNFISDLHIKTGGKLKYILLGGDAEKVPIRYLHANASRWAYDDVYLSDVYFSSPGTDWDADDDGRYGEREDLESIGIENLSFPLVVGRFPVSNSGEADLMVKRVIDYERSPPEGEWTSKGILSTSLMERPNIINDPGTPEDEGFDAYKDNGYKSIANYTLRYFPRSIEMEEYHDYTEYFGGSYSSENDTLGITTLPDAISNGSAIFSFAGQSFYDIDYGHSPSIAYSLAQYIDPAGLKSGGEAFAPALTYEDNWNLTNGGKLPVAYISSCDSANFSSPGDISLENLVLSPEGGAICLIGSTGVSWRGEGEDYSLGNWYLMSKFWQKTVSSNMPGESLYWLKQKYVDTKWDEYATKEVLLIELYTYNLLGDPALRSWLGPPLTLDVSYLDDDPLYAGGDTLTARVTDDLGNPLANMVVSVYLNTTGEVFTQPTGPDGMVEIDVSFGGGGDATITVTGKNRLPFLGNLTVNQEPTDLAIDPDSISIAPYPLTEKTDATLSFNISNIGGRNADNVKVIISPGDPGDDVRSWGNIQAERIMSLPVGSSESLEITVSPLRSWKRINVGLFSDQVENILDNNIASIDIDVNAAPRFLTSELLEMDEDEEGGREFDLSGMVYDPDNDEGSLIYSLGTGSPKWVSLDGHLISVKPPANWSGSFDISVSVSDGLASDITSLTIFVKQVNDDPALLDIRTNYTAVVDSPFTLLLQPVDVEGDHIEIVLNTTLDRLKLLGNTLRILPYTEDVGIHQVNISIDDGKGEPVNYTFMLEVIPASGKLYFLEPSVKLSPAQAGERYSYLVEIGGDLSGNATFSDNSPLFDIDPVTGEISFKPSDDDIGEHWVTITVSNGNTTIQRTFLLEVEEKEEIDQMIYWVLGGIAVIILAALIAVVVWSGPRVEQYGLEE